jgi:ribosomal protein S12 methylthiotransferase accessory factor
MLRALTEMNQFLPAVSGVSPSGERDYGYMDPHAIQWWKTASTANQPYLVPHPTLPARRAGDFVSASSDDVTADVARCIHTAAALGMETLVLDQSRPDVNLRVSKIVVPGMRHFWARLAPGRLYDVPVRIGWLPRPLTEEQLNPIAMFL